MQVPFQLLLIGNQLFFSESVRNCNHCDNRTVRGIGQITAGMLYYKQEKTAEVIEKNAGPYRKQALIARSHKRLFAVPCTNPYLDNERQGLVLLLK
jgi:hypothetical protein